MGRRAGFAEKSLHHDARRDKLGLDQFDRDGLVQHQVRAAIDSTHPAALQEAIDPIFAVERLPDRLVLQAHGTFQNHAVIGANGLVSIELAPTLRTLTHAVMLSGSDERINRRPGGALASPGH